MSENDKKKSSNSDKVARQGPAINKAYVVVALIILGVIIIGYLAVGKVDIAGSYIHEDSLGDPYYELTVDIVNSGRTTLLERDYTNYTTFGFEFNTEYSESLDAYIYSPEDGVEVTYGIEEQGVIDYGVPLQFDNLEESYGFSREEEEGTILLTGQLADEDIDILNFDFDSLCIESVGEAIIMNDMRFVSQEDAS